MIASIDPVNLLCDLIEARVGSFEANALCSEAAEAVEFMSKIGAFLPGQLAATRALRRLKGSDTVPQQDSNGNLAVKLLRTFTAQTEALQRYRGKGQQKVTVEHVHVHTGGQAIFEFRRFERSHKSIDQFRDFPAAEADWRGQRQDNLRV